MYRSVPRKYFLGVSFLVIFMMLGSLFIFQAAPATVLAGGNPTISGSPFSVAVNSYGALDLKNNGQSQFYNQFGDSLFLKIGNTNYGSFTPATLFTPVSNGPVTGTGGAGDPFTIVTVFDAGLNVRVTQTTTYVNGANVVNVSYAFSLADLSGPGPNFIQPSSIDKVYFAADLYLSGGDQGYGYYNSTTRAVGAFNATHDNFVVFQPVSPATASAYQEDGYGNIWSVPMNGQDYNNTINNNLIDNGAGLQWNNVSIPGTISFLIGSGSQLEPPAEKPVIIPAELGAQLRVTPDRVAPNTAGTELTFNLFIKNLEKGKARLPYVILPIDPSLEVSYTNFPDSRDWVNNLVTDGDNPHLEIRFHDLEQDQMATASITFKVKAGVTPGAVVSQRFTAIWDDDVSVARSHQSNSIRVILSDNTTDQSTGKIQQFDPANPNVVKGSQIHASASFFAPNEKVSLWFTNQNGVSTSLGYQWADENGKISFTFNTAGLEPGTYAISGQGYISGFFASDKTTVSGQMVVVVSEGVQQFIPDNAVVTSADVIQYKGDFFLGGERVDLWLTGPDGNSISLGYVWADDHGCVSFPISNAGWVAGNYTVAAHGNESTVSAKVVITIGS